MLPMLRYIEREPGLD